MQGQSQVDHRLAFDPFQVDRLHHSRFCPKVNLVDVGLGGHHHFLHLIHVFGQLHVQLPFTVVSDQFRLHADKGKLEYRSLVPFTDELITAFRIGNGTV